MSVLHIYFHALIEKNLMLNLTGKKNGPLHKVLKKMSGSLKFYVEWSD